MFRLFLAIVLISASQIAIAGIQSGYVLFREVEAVPVLSPVGLAGLAVVVGIGAARVIRNRRNS